MTSKRTRRVLSWWENQELKSRVPPGTYIHGECRLPPGYHLCIAPPNASVKFAAGIDDQNAAIRASAGANVINGVPTLSSSYNFPKLVVSFVQAIWASVTLYRARGDQIQEYGYAAFGLTVAPYAWMSVVNIIANLLTPNYPALFMIRTPIMNEAEDAGGFFRCDLQVEVGEERGPAKTWYSEDLQSIDWAPWLGFILALVPLIIVGSLSGFAIGKSTSIQRGFTMSWLIIGILYGVFLGSSIMRGFTDLYGSSAMRDFEDKIRVTPNDLIFRTIGEIIGLFLVMGAPPIGGMVVVGLMLRGFGVCTRFG